MADEKSTFISWSTFYRAVVDGDSTTVKDALKTKDFRIYVESDTNVFLLAAKYGQKEMLKDMTATDIWQHMPLTEQQHFMESAMLSAIWGNAGCGQPGVLEWILRFARDNECMPDDLSDVHESATAKSMEMLQIVCRFVGDKRSRYRKQGNVSTAIQKGNGVLQLYMAEGQMTHAEVVEIVGCTMLHVGCSLNDTQLVEKELKSAQAQAYWKRNPGDGKLCPFQICCMAGNLECLDLLISDFNNKSDTGISLNDILTKCMFDIIHWNHLEIAKHVVKNKLVDMKLPHEWFPDKVHLMYRSETFEYMWKVAKANGCKASDTASSEMMVAGNMPVLEYFTKVLHRTRLDWSFLVEFLRRYVEDGTGTINMLFKIMSMIPELNNPKHRKREEHCVVDRAYREVRRTSKGSPPSSPRTKVYHQIENMLQHGQALNRGFGVCFRLPSPVLTEIMLDIMPESLQCPCGEVKVFNSFTEYWAHGPFEQDYEVDEEDEPEIPPPNDSEPFETKMKHAQAIFDIYARKGRRIDYRTIKLMIRNNMQDENPRSLHLGKLVALSEIYDFLLYADHFHAWRESGSMKWFGSKYKHKDEFLTRMLVSFCGSSAGPSRAFLPRVKWAGFLSHLVLDPKRKEHYLNLIRDCKLRLLDPVFLARNPTKNTVPETLYDPNIVTAPPLQVQCRIKIRQYLRLKCGELNRRKHHGVVTITEMVDRLCDENGAPILVRDYLHFKSYIVAAQNFEEIKVDNFLDSVGYRADPAENSTYLYQRCDSDRSPGYSDEEEGDQEPPNVSRMYSVLKQNLLTRCRSPDPFSSGSEECFSSEDSEFDSSDDYFDTYMGDGVDRRRKKPPNATYKSFENGVVDNPDVPVIPLRYAVPRVRRRRSRLTPGQRRARRRRRLLGSDSDVTSSTPGGTDSDDSNYRY